MKKKMPYCLKLITNSRKCSQNSAMVLAAVGEKNVWPSKMVTIITAYAEKNKLMVAAAVGE